MVQAKNGTIIATIIVVGIVILLAGMVAVNSVKNEIPEAPVIPTAAEIVAAANIPTAEEIAAQIDLPDTKYSIQDEKEAIAEDLAVEELDDRDVRRAIAEAIDDCDDTDLDRHDITSIVVKDVDVETSRRHGEDATVTLELKVYFDNYGDEAESARVDVEFEIELLDRDEDYEDAEVVGFDVGNSYSCSTE